MDEQAGVPTQRRRGPAEIEQIAAEFLHSGLGRTEFCRRHAISLGTLNRYLKRIQQSQSVLPQHGLVPVELADAKLVTDRDCGCGLTVVLLHGRRIEVKAGFDEPTLQRLIGLLENV
jgi:hypothetical protein